MANKRERRHLNKLINSNGAVSTEGNVKVEHDMTCAICLQNVDKKAIALDCGHEFHMSCLNKWANTYNDNVGKLCKARFGESKNICFYHTGQNLLSCPTCRCEYSKDLLGDGRVKQVLAKLHLVDDHDLQVTHYITRLEVLRDFIPQSEIKNEFGQRLNLESFNQKSTYKISKKWINILQSMYDGIELGLTDIYFVERIHPEREVVLSNERLTKTSVNNSGMVKIVRDDGSKTIYKKITTSNVLQYIVN